MDPRFARVGQRRRNDSPHFSDSQPPKSLATRRPGGKPGAFRPPLGRYRCERPAGRNPHDRVFLLTPAGMKRAPLTLAWCSATGFGFALPRVPTGGRRSKPSPRIFAVGRTRFRCASRSGAGLRHPPGELAGVPSLRRDPPSGQNAFSQVSLATAVRRVQGSNRGSRVSSVMYPVSRTRKRSLPGVWIQSTRMFA